MNTLNRFIRALGFSLIAFGLALNSTESTEYAYGCAAVAFGTGLVFETIVLFFLWLVKQIT